MVRDQYTESIRSFMALITGLAGFSFTVVAATMLQAQTLSLGARALAMANATVATSGLPFEPVNPAVRAHVRSAAVACSFGQAFGLEALRHNSLAAVLPIRSIQFGTAIESFGFDAFRRTTASFAVSAAAFRAGRLGLRFTGRHNGFRGYSGSSAAGISAGWLATVTPEITVGGMWRHVGAAMDPPRRILPQEIAVGFEARPSGETRISGAAVREAGFDTDIRIGVETSINGILTARAGTGTSPHRVAFGAGLHVDPVVVHLGLSLHAVLGTSFALTVVVG